jgi:uncharacterized protein involved in type VI secretion and phage assembly
MSAAVEEAVVRLTRQVEERRYGKFRGVVTDNKDPQKRGRLRLRIPAVLGDQESDWALPCLPYGGGATYGAFMVPPADAQVWVEFEEGDIHRPIWTGVFWQDGADVPPDASKDEPTTLLLQTPNGHILQFDDESGNEQTRLHHPSGAEMLIDKDGTVSLTDAGGAVVTLDANAGELRIEDSNGNSVKLSSSGVLVEDANGNKIEMASSGINVEGQQIVVKGTQVMLGGQGGEPVIKGTSFLTLFATHMHPTAMGPSGPPIPQGEMSSLSSKVMTS